MCFMEGDIQAVLKRSRNPSSNFHQLGPVTLLRPCCIQDTRIAQWFWGL